MAQYAKQPNQLGTLIAEIQRSKARAASVNDLIMICQRMAASYVLLRLNSGGFDPSRLGLSVDDYAFDAIAELFRPTESGSYALLEDLARAHEIPTLSQAQLETEVRIRVFNAVNRHTFRSYRDTDPILSKLLRNIKRMVQDHESVSIFERNCEWMIVPKGCNSLQQSMAQLTPEMMHAELSARSFDSIDLRTMLDTIGSILAEQSDHARMYPIMGIALLLRSVYVKPLAESVRVEMSDEMTDEELGRFLRPALGRVIQGAGGKYVKKGRVTEHDLRTYAHTLFDILMEEFTSSEEGNGSFFDLLLRHDPTVTRQEYLEKHRIVLEYLVRLVRREMQESIKNEWNSLQ